MGCGTEILEERTVSLEIGAEHLRQREGAVPVGDCSKDAGDEEFGAGLDVFFGGSTGRTSGVCRKRKGVH